VVVRSKCKYRLDLSFGCDLSQVIGQSANVGPEVTRMWCVHAKFKVYLETRPNFRILVSSERSPFGETYHATSFLFFLFLVGKGEALCSLAECW